MSDTAKNLLTGLAAIGALAAVIFVWVGIPMLWMSFRGPDGMEFTLLGAIWAILPVAVIVVSVIHWLGKAIRED